MEPIATILAAIVLGAAESLKSVTSQAIKDGYDALKKRLHDHYQHNEEVAAAFDNVIKKPEAAVRRPQLEQALKEAGADNDQELINIAKSLIDAVEKHNLELLDTDIYADIIKKINVTNMSSKVTANEIGELNMEGKR